MQLPQASHGAAHCTCRPGGCKVLLAMRCFKLSRTVRLSSRGWGHCHCLGNDPYRPQPSTGEPICSVSVAIFQAGPCLHASTIPDQTRQTRQTIAFAVTLCVAAQACCCLLEPSTYTLTTVPDLQAGRGQIRNVGSAARTEQAQRPIVRVERTPQAQQAAEQQRQQRAQVIREIRANSAGESIESEVAQQASSNEQS